MDNSNNNQSTSSNSPLDGLTKEEVLSFLQKLLSDKQDNQDQDQSSNDGAAEQQPTRDDESDDTERDDQTKKNDDSNDDPAPAKPANDQPAEKPANPAPAPSQGSSAADKPSNPAPAADNDSDSDDGDDEKKQKQPVSRAVNPNKKEVTKMDITPNNQHSNVEVIKRDFKHYLATGEISGTVKRAEPNGVNLQNGSVIIPETILTPEHEQHQFPRLGNLVRTVAVSTTTGKLPVFQTSDDVLDLHTEFDPSTRHKAPEIVPINWDLSTYTGNYAVSQDLISDSNYNWETELSNRLTELRDNTNDQLIMQQLTNGVTAIKSDDLIGAIKDVLDSKLKPQDSNAASIVLSQSAFAALDKMNDKMGRPLVQPDVTQGTGNRILGKTVVVIDDKLFPGAKAGDANIVIAPLQKAVINFHENEITGRFMDQYDVWYRILGIYMREDVVQARKDLINVITTTAATAKAVGGN